MGPIIAALYFGWRPALLWIVIGAIFVGGVHDYSALMASLRHRGRSIGDICRLYLSPFTYRVFLLFLWFALMYVLIVFLDLTAGTFAPAEAAESSVATSSMIYIGVALVFGLCVYKLKLRFWLASAIFVPLVFVGIYLGVRFPFPTEAMPAWIYSKPKYSWALILLAYCYFASILPVWVLLQPRDFLSSFLLFACLIGGGAGLIISGFTDAAPIQYPAFITWADPKLGPLFPALFIIIACGAVSGFHSVVSSGTTSKQINNEQSAKPVAYGSMLVEAVLAVIAVCAVMILPSYYLESGNPEHPTIIFANAIGHFLKTFGLSARAGGALGLLAVSTFLLTTLDTCTRLSRFILEEFFGLDDKNWRYLSTLLTLILPAVVVFVRIPDPLVEGAFIPAWKAVWPAFGSSNQLLGALALLVVFVWLARQHRARLFVLLPLIFMMVTTVMALFGLVRKHLFAPQGQALVGWISVLLLILACVVVGDAVRQLRKGDPAVPEEEAV